MIRFFLFITLLVIAYPAVAQDDPPFPEYPDFKPNASHMGDHRSYSLLLLDLFEVAPVAADVPARLEGLYRIGNDYTRFWLKGKGDGLISTGTGKAEVQALYSRLISPYVEAQAGVRLDTKFGEGDLRARPLLVVGLEGLAPYWFEVEPAVFVSAEGDLSVRLEASYDMLITQRLVIQRAAEVNFALQEVEDWGVGSGLNNIKVGLRLRYEIQREVAPYLGVSWTNRFGGAKDFAQAEGLSGSEVHLVFGVRLWR